MFLLPTMAMITAVMMWVALLWILLLLRIDDDDDDYSDHDRNDDVVLESSSAAGRVGFVWRCHKDVIVLFRSSWRLYPSEHLVVAVVATASALYLVMNIHRMLIVTSTGFWEPAYICFKLVSMQETFRVLRPCVGDCDDVCCGNDDDHDRGL